MTIHRLPYDQISFLKEAQLKRPPPFLDIACHDKNVDLLREVPHQGFAVVGSRTPQRKSHRFVETALSQLKGTSLVIVSGFARGIDSIAHEAAIQNGLKTIAIVGAGIDIDYPKENAHLRRRILETGGMIISAFDRDAPPRPGHFDLRNSLIAAFSKAIWVVEAAHGSGTLNTAKWASDLNRDLYATPAFPGDPDYQGNEKLLSERETHKHPVARSFFGAHSLEVTWSDLHPQRSFSFKGSHSLSTLQLWVKEIKHSCGECLVQMLLDHAITQGLNPGDFYRQYQRECSIGNLIEDGRGRIDIQSRGQIF